jgi:hypothetical protein
VPVVYAAAFEYGFRPDDTRPAAWGRAPTRRSRTHEASLGVAERPRIELPDEQERIVSPCPQ